MALQLSESAALAKVEAANSQIQQLEAYKLRAEQRLDACERTLFVARQEGRNRSKHLRQTIQSLRRQFAGALPLPQQEKFSVTMVSLQEDRAKAQEEKRMAEVERRRAEGRAEELELRLRGLEELITTLKDVKGAQKVILINILKIQSKYCLSCWCFNRTHKRHLLKVCLTLNR